MNIDWIYSIFTNSVILTHVDVFMLFKEKFGKLKFNLLDNKCVKKCLNMVMYICF